MAYNLEELWIEFYEDYYEAHPREALDHVTSTDNVQFVTGDAKVDCLEKMIAEGASDDEIDRELASWEGESPDTAPPVPVTEDAIFQDLENDLSFSDDYVR